MKSFLPKFILLLFVVALAAGCRQQASCPAYAQNNFKVSKKPFVSKVNQTRK